MNTKFTFLNIFLLAFVAIGYGQNLEFIQNKGQWNAEAQYSAPFATGNFYLRANGYTLLQHHNDDVEKLGRIAHGHLHNDKEHGEEKPRTF
jgi:hypothetical protein